MTNQNHAAEAAMQEGERNAAAHDYFEARREIDSAEARRIFEAGFNRAYVLLSTLRAEGVQEATPAEEPPRLRPPIRRISGIGEGVLRRAAMRHRATTELQDASSLAALADGLESIAGNENAELAAIHIRRQADRMASAWEANRADFNAWHKQHFGVFVPVLPLHDARLIGRQAGTANERSPVGNQAPRNHNLKLARRPCMARFVTIEKASEATGYSQDAIRTKKRDGIWREGHEWVEAPDGRILIDMEGYEKWVETDGVLKPPLKTVSKSRFNTRGRGAVSGFLLSPRPLT